MTPRWRLRTTLLGVAVMALLLALISADLRRSKEIHAPDLIDVEVASAGNDRPVSGTRIVRPDGNINLGLYGNVEIRGLTPNEARSKIAAHLRHRPVGRERFATLDSDGVRIRVVRKNTSRGVYIRIMYDVFHSPDFGPG